MQFAFRFCQEMREHREKAEIDWSVFSQIQKSMMEKILCSPDKFVIEMDRQQQLMMEFINEQEQIVQFGCGSDGIRLLSYMRTCENLEKIVCITDNNPKLQGKNLFGIPIVSPEAVRRRYPHCGYVVSSLNYGGEIRKQLEQSGVDKEQIMISCL